MTSLRAVMLVGMGVASAGGPTLVTSRIEVASGSQIVWSAPIVARERFDLAFRHSQERVRWVQEYEAGIGPTIWQRGTTFPSYGAGMPLGPVSRTSHGFHAVVERRLDDVPMLNSRDAAMTLQYRGTSLPIGQWFQDFEPFVIRVR